MKSLIVLRDVEKKLQKRDEWKKCITMNYIVFKDNTYQI